MKLTGILLLSCVALILLPKILNYKRKPAYVKSHARPVAVSPYPVEVIHGSKKTVNIVAAPGESEPKQ
jgi:hypothetical protein